MKWQPVPHAQQKKPRPVQQQEQQQPEQQQPEQQQPEQQQPKPTSKQRKIVPTS
jgi:hypothetical protein